MIKALKYRNRLDLKYMYPFLFVVYSCLLFYEYYISCVIRREYTKYNVLIQFETLDTRPKMNVFNP